MNAWPERCAKVLVIMMLLMLPAASVSAQEAAFTVTSIDRQTYADLKVSGFPDTSENREYDLFMLADASEEGFSGKVLTEQIPQLHTNHPGRIRTWYVHVVLNYRQSRSDVLVSSRCLADQNALWPNMKAYVENDAQPYPKFGLYGGIQDQERFARCLTDGNAGGLDADITERTALLNRTGAVGIPTAVIVRNGAPERAVIVQGAQPIENFLRAFDAVSTQPTVTPVVTSDIRVTAEPVLPYPVRVWRAFTEFIRTLFGK